ncbi:MAG: hypothetical protein HQ512_09925 [Rhodospirillales bacterium]|nr:hypothetical protein [Rhodospirillales bacterium]
MKRGLIFGGLGVVAVIAGVAFFLLSNLDSLIKEAVERVGGEATLARVSLSKVEISLQSGSGSLSGLTVGNPKGFKTPSSFELGSISVTLDTGSIGKDPIVIKEITISKPQVTYEVGSGGSNIDAIKKNVDAYAKKFSSGGGSKAESEGPKLVIENLYIRGGQINVSAAFLQGKSLSTPLPNVHLKDIGKKKKGASPAEVANKIISSMTKGAGSAVGALNLDKMMEGATKGAKDAAKAVQEGASDAGKVLEKGLGDAGSGLKKLFSK